MKKGFTVIEILISMMVLFVAIAFVNISIKAFNDYQRKSAVYQNFYITALSLKNKMDSNPLEKESYKGTLNDINYIITKQEILKQKNYITSFEAGAGNIGDFFITLYQLKMILKNKTRTKEYTFYLTRQRRENPLVKLGGEGI
ncbi:MAG TPA: hypothetical protein EYG73_01405 [Arcobacter sp.]|nr:hypothetical protein [Arcobacter sp.]